MTWTPAVASLPPGGTSDTIIIWGYADDIMVPAWPDVTLA